MKKEQLRSVLKEANDKGQTGLLIWANWTIWDDIAFEMKPGNRDYDFAVSRISQNLPAVITCYNNGFKILAFTAISVGKLSCDEDFFNRVLELCNKHNYQGPFTLLPSNETVSAREADSFVLIEASKLSLDDDFLQYEPQTKNQQDFKKNLTSVIKSGVKDFYRPIYDPSFDENGNIVFVAGRKPAVGHSYNWWVKAAKRYMPERGSRLGTKDEYVAFLGVLIKKLVAGGWSVADAWHAVCDDSKMLGHYWNSENAKHDFEETGSREVCGFFDLANTCKILAWDDEIGRFWLASGLYFDSGSLHPLADLGLYRNRDGNYSNSVGWYVL